ncbi:YifB family Mg chelatase-like AAA ATPase [Treponema zuelzerae]|uniref:YifB family Mg chelatase-like AAA ATPase n=1 Tax=Teretinema zuelzerae TaxID=156 RepID=A0AAE3EH94_9SPIR|nr:YifB family Mg chelatase-like AAA ATPase [Teretinema zuelzerae]MCD1653736.1 YifB family Mg chelatase-like AAA ATPase [Teretinema zuelzerae]
MQIVSFARAGYTGEIVKVEADLRRGIPAIDIVGLPDGAVREARERMRVAIRNSGLDFPRERILINLSPADLKKEGGSFDLPIALGVLAASEGNVPEGEAILVLGELELSGTVRPVRGVLAAVARAQEAGIADFILPAENLEEARLLGAPARGARNLAEALNAYHEICSIRALCGSDAETEGSGDADGAKDISAENNAEEPRWRSYRLGYEDVRGQERLVRGLQIAAAGGHHLVAWGPPGCGKSLALGRFDCLLPDMDRKTALEATRIHSIAGTLEADFSNGSRALLSRPPFRQPHQNASLEGMIGGGKHCLPGEISLAHGGTLFLDEAAQFRSGVLQALRTPLETGTVTLSRAGKNETFPADFQLLMALNPCPCGHFGESGRVCTCGPEAVDRYWKRLAGPLLDRMDIRVPLSAPEGESFADPGRAPDTESLRREIDRARRMQRERGAVLNGKLAPGDIEKLCVLSESAQALFGKGMETARLSGRGGHGVLKVSRTIADMEGSVLIEEEHLMEAFQFRRWSGLLPDFLS